MGMYFNKKVSLNQTEQRYMASCDCPVDYPHSNIVQTYKKSLAESSKTGSHIDITSSELLLPFPTLAYLIGTEGLGEKKSIQSYFEGMDKNSHNYKLYRFVKNASKNQKIKKELLTSMFDHAQSCSVKLAGKDRIWSIYGSMFDEKFDNIFEIPSSKYFLVHGQTEKGNIIIREASEKEAEKFKKLPELWNDISYLRFD